MMTQTNIKYDFPGKSVKTLPPNKKTYIKEEVKPRLDMDFKNTHIQYVNLETNKVCYRIKNKVYIKDIEPGNAKMYIKMIDAPINIHCRYPERFSCLTIVLNCAEILTMMVHKENKTTYVQFKYNALLLDLYQEIYQ